MALEDAAGGGLSRLSDGDQPHGLKQDVISILECWGWSRLFFPVPLVSLMGGAALISCVLSPLPGENRPGAGV